MKLDKTYSSIKVCPVTYIPLSDTQNAYSDGICPHCGNIENSTFTHSKLISGKWARPNFIKSILGVKPVFQPKESL